MPIFVDKRWDMAHLEPSWFFVSHLRDVEAKREFGEDVARKAVSDTEAAPATVSGERLSNVSLMPHGIGKARQPH